MSVHPIVARFVGMVVLHPAELHAQEYVEHLVHTLVELHAVLIADLDVMFLAVLLHVPLVVDLRVTLVVLQIVKEFAREIVEVETVAQLARVCV